MKLIYKSGAVIGSGELVIHHLLYLWFCGWVLSKFVEKLSSISFVITCCLLPEPWLFLGLEADILCSGPALCV